MNKYLGNTIYELSYLIPDLNTYLNTNISSKDVADICMIVEKANPHPGYEIMSATKHGIIFKQQ